MQAIGHGGPRTQAGLESPAPVIVLEFHPPRDHSFGAEPDRPEESENQASAGGSGRLAGHRHRHLERPGHPGHLETSRRHLALLVLGAG